MYKRDNTVYPVLQNFFQKAYPVINQILGKRYPGRYLINIQKKTPSWAAQYTYSKSIEEPLHCQPQPADTNERFCYQLQVYLIYSLVITLYALYVLF